MIESFICVVLTNITCSVNESAEKITKKIKYLLYLLNYTQACNKFERPIITTLLSANTAPFEEKW